MPMSCRLPLIAELLLPLNPDMATLQAALLHDVLEDTGLELESVEKNFGEEVSGLVEGMNRLSLVKIRKEDTEAENWKKMFLAMAKDVLLHPESAGLLPPLLKMVNGEGPVQ